MPGNWGYLTNDIKAFVENNIPKEASVLDIGCGHGYYPKLLKDHFINKMDGVEIWEQYIKEYELHNLYNNIYNTNILDFKFDYYNFIILGDILEHLSREDAVSLIEYLCARCDEILVVVPYNLPQDVVNNNIYEVHLQPDLSDEVMSKYYPLLEIVKINGKECKIKIEVGTNIYHYCAFRKKQ